MLTTSAFLNYDAMGRVQWYLQCNPDNCGGGGWSTTYTYDFAGDVLTMQHPEGFTLSNTISGAQRITQVSSSLNNSTHPPVLASGITYTPWGALSSLTNGCAPSGSCTNLQETYTYNNRLQPTGVQLSTSSSAYYSLAYNYSWSGVQIPGCPLQSQNTGNNGNVMGYTYTDSQNSGLSHTATYFYDNVNRLVCAQATGNSTYNLDFTYDPYGNMACPATNQYNQGYCAQHGFNSYNQISDSGYIYDAVGDLTQEPGRTSQYDGEQRAVNVNNGSTVSFTYNALGQRVQATWGSNAYDFLFDPNGTWLGGEGSGAVYLGSRPVAFENPATGADFMHVNPLGSTTMETSYNGGVASDVLFYPWGQLWNYAEITNFQFAGTIWMDGVSSADFANYRLYRYDQGRWLTPDPAGLAAADITDPQSLNLYAYALNKPTTLTDPLGLFEDCPNGVIQDNQCIQGTPSDNDNDDGELPWSDRIIDVVSYYHPPRSGDSPVANNGTQQKTPNQQCIDNFLKNNYGNFVGGEVIPDFSLISIGTNFGGYAKSSALTLAVKGGLIYAPKALSWVASTTGNNLAAYPGMATASADALEWGAFWGTTAATAEWVIAPAAVGAVSFSTTADADARWSCRNVQ